MFVCPTISELRFYGCCHPCFQVKYEIYEKYWKKINRIEVISLKKVYDNLVLYKI